MNENMNIFYIFSTANTKMNIILIFYCKYKYKYFCNFFTANTNTILFVRNNQKYIWIFEYLLHPGKVPGERWHISCLQDFSASNKQSLIYLNISQSSTHPNLTLGVKMGQDLKKKIVIFSFSWQKMFHEKPKLSKMLPLWDLRC